MRFGVPSLPLQLFSPGPCVVSINKSKAWTVMVTQLVLCVPSLLVIVSTHKLVPIIIVIHVHICN
ncbi:hypothetical protein LINGRAHAP2_LOCUS8110 [Linum grandiflorum]